MDDKDVRRLDERISASEERAQLRLDAAMGRVEAALTRLADQNVNLAENIRQSRSAQSAWGQWIIGTILVVALAFMGLAIGLKQVWVGGVQVGQAAPHTQATPPVVQNDRPVEHP